MHRVLKMRVYEKLKFLRKFKLKTFSQKFFFCVRKKKNKKKVD